MLILSRFVVVLHYFIAFVRLYLSFCYLFCDIIVSFSGQVDFCYFVIILIPFLVGRWSQFKLHFVSQGQGNPSKGNLWFLEIISFILQPFSDFIATVTVHRHVSKVE